MLYEVITAMVDKGLPYVIPLNFGYKIEDNSLVLFFHSAREGRKIDILKEYNAVCFEMAYVITSYSIHYTKLYDTDRNHVI